MTNQLKFRANDARIGGMQVSRVLVCVGVAMAVLIQTQLAPANIQLGEVFNYADGTLNGRGIGDSYGDFSNWGNHFQFERSLWTSDFVRAPDSSLDFVVSSNTLSPRIATGVKSAQTSYRGSVSRNFSLPYLKNVQFAGTFTAGGATSEQYATTMDFSGATGTAHMGIRNGQFVMQFGDQPEISAGRVMPDTPYTLVANVEFGVPVTVDGKRQTGERMQVFVNESSESLLAGQAKPLFSASSATGMRSLGNLFGISSEVSAGFLADPARTLIFDDVFIGTSYQEVNGFRHDISPDGKHTQPGTLSWDVQKDGLAKLFTHDETHYGDVLVTISGNNVVALDGGDVGGIAGDLKRDGVRADGELMLSLEGLHTGLAPNGDPYVLKTYHHSPNTDAQLSPIDIFLDSGAAEEYVMTIDPSAADGIAAHSSIGFSAMNAYANFRFVTHDGSEVWLNGFELVPEPSSILMTLCGLIWLVEYACRRRQS